MHCERSESSLKKKKEKEMKRKKPSKSKSFYFRIKQPKRTTRGAFKNELRKDQKIKKLITFNERSFLN